MKFIINMVAKLGGISRLWGFLDGYKTKVAGVAALLSGLAGLVGALVPLIEAKDAAAWFAFFRGLPADQSWMMLVGGLATLGVGHKLEKAADPVEPPKP